METDSYIAVLIKQGTNIGNSKGLSNSYIKVFFLPYGDSHLIVYWISFMVRSFPDGEDEKHSSKGI